MVASPFSELLQEAHVVFEDQAQVADLKAAHRQTLQTHAEGPAGVDVRVDAAALEHLRVDHAGAEDLDPALALAGGAALAAALVALHVHLAARLGEREVVRAEAGDGVFAVELAHERVERALQIRHRDALVDDHALDLVEHGRMRSVDLILSVDAAGRDHADRQGLALHRTHLHRGGLRAQENAAVLGQIERIRPFAGGVPLGGVKLGEVILGLLDLRAFEDLKAHADEDVLDLVEHDVHRVLVAELRRFAGHGHIERLGLEAHLEHARIERLAALLECCLKLRAYLVCQLAHGRALLRRQAAHLLEDGG